jgi:DNA polymerase I
VATESTRRPLLIVDGDNLAHRAYHSSPKNEPDQPQTNAIVGFFGMLMRIYAEERPRHAFIGWDTLGVETYRNALWPPYQGGRSFDESIVHQLGLLPDICRAFGFGVGKAGGYEADDLMAAAALKEVAGGGTALILTTDKDSYQLVSDSITVISPQRGTRELARIGPEQVKAIFGVTPGLVPDFKALAGDASDKIPGLKGCGPKTAAAMLDRHASLDQVIAAGAVGKGEQLLMFREVARMRPEVEVNLPTGEPDWRAGSAALASLGLSNLAERVATFS